MDNMELLHAGVKGMRWGVRRYQNKDGSLTPAGKKRYSEDSFKVKQIRQKKVRQMSNQELKDVNNRLQLEKTYGELTKKKNRGQQAVKAYIATAGTITAVVAATGTYKKYGAAILAKIGSMAV